MIEFFTRSPLVHCAVGNAAYVVNVGYDGVVYPWTTSFVVHHPGLVWMFVVETPREAHPADFDHERRISTCASLLRLFTFGVTSAHNCVTVSCAMLRESGVDVPRRITTPVGLYDWLRRSGYEQVELGRYDDL